MDEGQYAAIVSDISDPAVFVRPVERYNEERICKCGKKYRLSTPYKKCNKGVRDLCDDCLYPDEPVKKHVV